MPVRLVSVPTLVLSPKGAALADLGEPDFRVFDNDAMQRVHLDTGSGPASVVVAVQVNQDVRSYLPFIARVGSAIDALLVGDRGHSALLLYNEDVRLAKPFESGDLRTAMRKIRPSGSKAHLLDAAGKAIDLLEQRVRPGWKILLIIGQPVEAGSEAGLDSIEQRAEERGISIFALSLPQFGGAFVSDTFSLQGLSGADKEGYKANVDLGKLVPALKRVESAAEKGDPISILTRTTGGAQLHFRKQAELEDAIGIIGAEFRSSYLLSFTPSSSAAGYHRIKIEVDVPGATVYARPGYRRR